MNILLSAAGVSIFCLVIYAAFQFGRKTEADIRSYAEAYAAACLAEYQNHINSMFYATESRRRWMASMIPPHIPTVEASESLNGLKPTQYRPSEDPAFVRSFHENGQATVWLEPRNGGYQQ